MNFRKFAEVRNQTACVVYFSLENFLNMNSRAKILLYFHAAFATFLKLGSLRPYSLKTAAKKFLPSKIHLCVQQRKESHTDFEQH